MLANAARRKNTNQEQGAGESSRFGMHKSGVANGDAVASGLVVA